MQPFFARADHHTIDGDGTTAQCTPQIVHCNIKIIIVCIVSIVRVQCDHFMISVKELFTVQYINGLLALPTETRKKVKISSQRIHYWKIYGESHMAITLNN